jgi:hypothetical protein
MPLTNTLAYFAAVFVIKKKTFNIDTSSMDPAIDTVICPPSKFYKCSPSNHMAHFYKKNNGIIYITVNVFNKKLTEVVLILA